MFYRLGQFVAAHAKAVLTAAGVLVAVCAILGVGVFGRLLSAGFDDPASSSSQAKALLDQKFGGEPDMIFLVHARSGTVDDAGPVASGTTLARRLSADPRLREVTSYWTTRAPSLRSRTGADALILTSVVGDEKQASDNATALLRAYGNLDDSAVTVRIGGARGTDISGQVGKDLGLAESIAVPITVILLILAFGSLVAAFLPLSIGVVAIICTFAELRLLTDFTDVSIFSINLTTALGLGLGIDYALLSVSRFREELASGVDVQEAVARTTASAGRTIAFSALTVAAALAALLVFPVYFLRSFAYAGVAVTTFAAAGGLLVLPALLALLGFKVNAGRVPGIKAVRSAEAPFWGRLASTVMRRPVIAAVPVIAVLLFLAVPLLGVTFSTPDDRVLPTGAPSHQVGDALRTEFATAPTVIDVLVTSPIAPPMLADYSRSLSELSGVQRADSAAGSFAGGQPSTTAGVEASALSVTGTERISLSTGLVATSAAAQDLVHAVRASPRRPACTCLSVARPPNWPTPRPRSARACRWPPRSSWLRRSSCCSCSRAASSNRSGHCSATR